MSIYDSLCLSNTADLHVQERHAGTLALPSVHASDSDDDHEHSQPAVYQAYEEAFQHAKDDDGLGRSATGQLSILVDDDTRELDDTCSLHEGTEPQSAAPMPSRRILERHNAELSSELMTSQSTVRQLEARLEASRTLCDQLQRALVDAASPQGGILQPDAIADTPEASKNRMAPTGPIPHQSSPAVALNHVAYLANTSTEVLELQVQLAEKDGRLLDMAARLQELEDRERQYFGMGLCSSPSPLRQLDSPSRRTPICSPNKARPPMQWASPAQANAARCHSQPLSDVTNAGSSRNNSKLAPSPEKRAAAAQSLAAALAAERAKQAKMNSCLAALAEDIKCRDATLSRHTAAQLTEDGPSAGMQSDASDEAAPDAKQSQPANSNREAAEPELDAVQLVASAATCLLHDLDLACKPAPVADLCSGAAADGENTAVPVDQLRTPGQPPTCQLAARDETASECAIDSNAASPGGHTPLIQTLSSIAGSASSPRQHDSTAQSEAGGASDAATAAAADDERSSAADAQTELPLEEQAKQHSKLVRRLCDKFDRQVVGLKLEYQLLEATLTERDTAIAELRSQLRHTSRAAQTTAANHCPARHVAHVGLSQAEASEAGATPGSVMTAEERRRAAAAAAAAEAAAVTEMRSTVIAAQRGRADDARRTAKDVRVLRERAGMAEARCSALQRQLDAVIADYNAHGLRHGHAASFPAPARAALADAERHKKGLTCVQEALSKKRAKLDAVLDELEIVSQSIASREQVVVTLRAELGDARQAAADATAKLTNSRHKLHHGPWR